MAYTPQDVNRLIQEQKIVETRVLFVHWATGDHVEAFREDSKRLISLFRRLNYPSVQQYAIPEKNSMAGLEKEIWKHLQALQGARSVFVLYYGGHGEKGGKGRWVAHDKIGQEPAVEWQSIQKQLARFQGRILVIMDTCFAGSAMRSAEDYNDSLRNMVGLQRGPKEKRTSIVPGNVELWLATSFHGQTPVKEPTFTQAIVHTLDSQLTDAGTSITVLRAHKTMLELESGNKLQCQPIYQPLENSHQRSIEIHYFNKTIPFPIEQTPSTNLELRLYLNALDEDTMPMLIQWLAAHPSNVISQECRNIETCIRAAHHHVSQDMQTSSPQTSLTPFQNLSKSLKERTFEAYQALTQSALALLSVQNRQPGADHSGSTTDVKGRVAIRELEGAWTKFKTQMQQNILLGPDNSEENVMLRMMEDPETRKMGLSQIPHMRLLAMRNDEEPAHSVPSSLARFPDAGSEGPLIILSDGVHSIEYKRYPENIDRQLRTIHETRIDRLAKVLREASSDNNDTSPTEFLTMNCLGYFSDTSNHRFGLKFELPRRHESSPEPVTLWRALKSGKRYRLPLQTRLSLAKKIGKALLNWHLAS